MVKKEVFLLEDLVEVREATSDWEQVRKRSLPSSPVNRGLVVPIKNQRTARLGIGCHFKWIGNPKPRSSINTTLSPVTEAIASSISD
jgi:hypothetical protein